MYNFDDWTTKELHNALECEREQLFSFESSLAWLKGNAKKKVFQDIAKSEELCNAILDELRKRHPLNPNNEPTSEHNTYERERDC